MDQPTNGKTSHNVSRPEALRLVFLRASEIPDSRGFIAI